MADVVIDLDALDHNIDTVVASISKVPGRHFRVVEKSLPSPKLLGYISARARTNRLMSPTSLRTSTRQTGRAPSRSVVTPSSSGS